MPALETAGLTKYFKDFKAVDAIDLNIPEGSVYGFLGPNGAGKTTTIRMLTGLAKPTSGKIYIFGKEAFFANTKNRDIMGYLPDVPNFYDWMTAKEFLEFSGKLFNISRNTLRERIPRLIDLVGLSEISKKIGSYSRGMKQRLGIAQALINDPRIVFLDEPTSALDPIGRKDVLDIIRKLAGKTTVFFSTHILADIERVCDRVVIINQGKKLLEDSLVNLRHLHSLQCIEIEICNEKEKLVTELAKKDWINNVIPGGDGSIKVYVNDINLARNRLPEIISRLDLSLKRFNEVEPSLEEIFMEAVLKK